MKSDAELISALTESDQYIKLKGLAGPRRFNVFDALDEAFSENTSSRFLRHILDSDEGHGLGMKVVQALVNLQSRPIPTEVRKAFAHTESTSATFNARTSDGYYLDILAVGSDDEHRPTFALGIENKIDASEQPDQLRHYQAHLIRTFQRVPKAILYLTKYGDAPTTADESANCPVISISHGDISGVLTKIAGDERNGTDWTVLLSPTPPPA